LTWFVCGGHGIVRTSMLLSFRAERGITVPTTALPTIGMLHLAQHGKT
jgi:hypothetical protein